MSQSAEDLATLAEDADLDQPLKRVAYEPGMLLGVEATRDEQQYHRRRLTRHQYWLHGAGTLAGMAVNVDAPTGTDPTKDTTVRLLVDPGVGIDGLGREVTIVERYCINLGDWIAAQDRTGLEDAFYVLPDSTDGVPSLNLRVMVRYSDCPTALQPVLAWELNAGTDAVQSSRIADSIVLELLTAPPHAPETVYRPWAAHPAIAEDVSARLTDAEQKHLGASPSPVDQLRARLVYGLGPEANTDLPGDLAEIARILLASLSIAAPATDSTLDDIVVNPAHIQLNNLVRPFVVTPGQLEHLSAPA
ncbi:MAG TPA: hypothetical protein VKA50_03490 [Gammaproteobacteria bacterium]|nr:hypothetical protein [Gammaproteobacteria bacterium]